MRTTLLFLLVSLLLGGGCADVKIAKIPTPTQYDQWTDEDQRRADCMEGFRFYMQRPFLAVYEPFPVHAKSYLVSGRVSADGRYVTLDGLPATGHTEGDELRQVMRLCYSCDCKVPTGELVSTFMVAEDSGSQRTRKGGAQSEPGAEVPATPPADPAPASEPEPTGPLPTAPLPNVIGGMQDPGSRGISDLGVTVVNDPLPTTPLRSKLFDIVNMPDFDEQFVVRRHQGIGSDRVDITLGQGNLLQGFDARMDNSSVANLLYGLMYSAANVGVARFLNPMGLEAMQAGAVASAKAQTKKGGAQSTEGELFLPAYSPVTMRVHVVTYATPGLYPIMKPRECADWARATSTRGWGGKTKASCVACRDTNGDFVVRIGPYGIPYHTFQYVLVEHLDRGSAVLPVVKAPEPPAISGDAIKKDVADKVIKSLKGFTPRVEVGRGGRVSVFVHQAADHGVLPSDSRTAWVDAIAEVIADHRGTRGDIGVPLSADEHAQVQSAMTPLWAEKEWTPTVKPEVDGKVIVEAKKANATASSDDLDRLMLKVIAAFNVKNARGREFELVVKSQ